MSDNNAAAQDPAQLKEEEAKLAQQERDEAERFNEGNPGSHEPLDSKDERSIANRLANESRRKSGDEDSEETRLHKKDPRLPALMHGNKPSRGARIDAEIAAEEEEELRRKGKA